MPIPNTPKPLYPNVPPAPGVPPLLRLPGQIISTVVLLASDAAIALRTLGILQTPQWGLFTSAGLPALTAAANGLAAVLTGSGQSVGDMEFRIEHRISTAPQEQGAFMSYNKVSTPFAGRVTYIVSGTQAQRTQFLGQVIALQNSLTLLTLVMPEYNYPSCTVTHHDFRRTSRNGLTMLSVDIWVEQVRVTGTAAYSNTATPSAAPQTNGGTVQPQTPGSGQTPTAPSNDTGPGTGGPNGVGGSGANTTIGQPSEPYYDDDGKQIGVAPSTTPSNGPIIGSYANGQPVIGGPWQQGFTDTNGNFVHP